VHVGVQVDQARRDELAADVDDLTRAVAGKGGGDRGDPATTYRHVVAADVATADVDDIAAGEHQIVRHRSPVRTRSPRRSPLG
jgi:hypothetical protein